jgi:hypothetical protein
MSLNKRVFLLLVFFNLNLSHFNPTNITKLKNNPNYHHFSNQIKREKMGEIIDNRVHVLNEIRGKTNDVMFESRLLRVKIEIYNVFIKILFYINIVFLVIILFLLSYKIYLYFKGEKIEKLYKIKLSNNNLSLKEKKKNYNIIIESEINNDKQNSLLEKELLNRSGIEAPSIEKYYKNTL